MSFPWCKWRIDWTLGNPKLYAMCKMLPTNIFFIGNIQISTFKNDDIFEVFNRRSEENKFQVHVVDFHCVTKNLERW